MNNLIHYTVIISCVLGFVFLALENMNLAMVFLALPAGFGASLAALEV